MNIYIKQAVKYFQNVFPSIKLSCYGRKQVVQFISHDKHPLSKITRKIDLFKKKICNVGNAIALNMFILSNDSRHVGSLC